MSNNIKEVQSDSMVYQNTNPSGMESDNHYNRYYTALMGYDNETGYYVDHDQIHRTDDNRFVAAVWFSNDYSWGCNYQGYDLDMKCWLQNVHLDFEVPSNQVHTTFDQYHPNETSKEEVEKDYDVGFGAAIGYGPLSLGASVSENNSNMNFSSHCCLNYDLDKNGSVSLPTDENKIIGFETDIDSDYYVGDSVDVTLSSQSDYSIRCGTTQLYYSTPELEFTSALEVVD
ncbi:hypothetical protein GS429_16785 [Natronorubrum sp. JWXQ-INN-674]|uniref:Uncharacterized protein n=1 Tax=Natronorubrum halalkaliphilum TaxID=2691917 RepID=A0A6B0VQT4_9EURY|nr:hypothetical protein [Natronorubrum halalkaliphilum]MXV63685.1 hypothetical protein [Natronorubrum halalkaliphilum]